MLVSRRKFIWDGALLGAFAATPLAAFARNPGHCANSAIPAGPDAADKPVVDRVPASDSLESLTQESFARQLNTRFELLHDAAAGSIPLILTGLVDIKAQCGNTRTAAMTLESFALSFSCAQGRPLPQGAYTLKHAELGSFALFLVPANHTYEAVINRLKV